MPKKNINIKLKYEKESFWRTKEVNTTYGTVCGDQQEPAACTLCKTSLNVKDGKRILFYLDKGMEVLSNCSLTNIF